MLRASEIDTFVRDGFVHVANAFPREIADACRELLWQQLEVPRDDPTEWREPVIRIVHMTEPPFVAATNTAALHEAFDQLVGRGRWVPRPSIGTIPVRFPCARQPDDAGWHVDGSYLPDGATAYFLNLRSDVRALLMLFLFSDVGPNDAPTRIRVGSHVAVPPVLERYGEAGASFMDVAAEVVPTTAGNVEVAATGAAGDVYLCHPFLVHAAQAHHGETPRFLGQPPLHWADGCTSVLDRSDGAYSPVERAVRLGLEVTGST